MHRPNKHAAPGEGTAAAAAAGKANPLPLLDPGTGLDTSRLTAGRLHGIAGAELRPPVMRAGAMDAARIPSLTTGQPRRTTPTPVADQPAEQMESPAPRQCGRCRGFALALARLLASTHHINASDLETHR